jgi:uncharacterized protein (TIGR03790 family)
MTTTLTQSTQAAFPDRPIESGIGLHATMSSGGDGEYVAYQNPTELVAINFRCVLSVTGVVGGAVVVAAGFNASGVESFRMGYDPTTGTLTAALPGGVNLNAALPAGLSWHCVEIRIDPTASSAQLWINGVSQDQTSAAGSLLNTQTIWLGCVLKDPQAVGELFLDEVKLADSYSGPVNVQPTSPYADDPARWVVVYNTADSDASLWVESYRQARGVPFANLIGLALPVTETIDASEFADLDTSIQDYVSTHNLTGQVMGVLLGYRVPGYVDFAGTGVLDSVPALLHRNAAVPGAIPNANAVPVNFQRLTHADLAGDRLTARIDGPDLASATALIDRATVLSSAGLGEDNDTALYFDPFVGSNPSYQTAFQNMIAWSQSLDRMRTRLPIQISGDPSGNTEASFASVSNDGFFWGWSSTLPDPDIFPAPAGKRALSVQLYLEGASATTLRGASALNWIDKPINEGYAAAAASSKANPVTAIPDSKSLFGVLVEGWTLAEAWYTALPTLREGFYLVGDPLMTPIMPRGGLDVFGPLQNLTDLDPATATLLLREDESPADLSAITPANGEEGIYVIRRRDGLGRLEASTRLIRVVNQSGVAKEPPAYPLWPYAPDWLVMLESAQAVFTLCWPGPIKQMRADSAELFSQAQGQAELSAAQPALDPLADHVKVSLAIPSATTRYRWVITSSNGVSHQTPWSAWLEPAAAVTQSLQTIGANP